MESTVESKFIVGPSGSGKSVKALREAWEIAKSGKRVVFAYTRGELKDIVDLIHFAIGDEYNVLIEASSLHYVKVNGDLTDEDISNINDQFEHNTLDVLFVDGATAEVSIDLIEGVEKVVYVTQEVFKTVHLSDVVVEEPTAEDRIGR